MQKLRVVVADDEPAILRGTEIMLEELGFEVATAESLREILPVLRSMQPHVLLQDVRMPGLDIDSHVASVRADPALAGMRIVLFSADLRLAETAARVRADAFIEKPFLPETLRASLTTLAA